MMFGPPIAGPLVMFLIAGVVVLVLLAVVVAWALVAYRADERLAERKERRKPRQ